MGRFLKGALMALLLVSGVATAHAQRPGPGDRYDDDAVLRSYAPADSRVRVWYVSEGEDAVPPGDVAPADGVPDYVDEIARVADESHAIYVDLLGFRAPLVDADLLPADEVGGDERFDIYLLHFPAADGQFSLDACEDASNHCAGHMVVENDFLGASYPSLSIAIRVVVSHEYFHAIQAAYDSGQDIKWSEGTAVWAEEQAYPEQDDYERFLSAFLDKPFRPFDRASGSSFGDAYPYGAALWPSFLSERFDPAIVRAIWEACDGGVEYIDATSEILDRDHAIALEDAWREFSHWNLFTAERADPARSYADGGAWSSVYFEDALSGDAFAEEYAMEGLSARYLAIALPDVGGETRYLTLSSNGAVVATAFLWDGSAMSPAMPLEQHTAELAELPLSWGGEITLYVVLTGVVRGAPSRRATLTLQNEPLALPEPPEPPESPESPESPSSSGGCSAAGVGDHAPGSSTGLLALVALLWSTLGRRRVARVRHLLPALGALALLAGSGGLARAQAQPAPETPSEPPLGDTANDDDQNDDADEIIVVTGSRVEQPLAEATVATQVITRTEIEASGASNLSELLATQPGVDIDHSGFRGSSVRMQGLDPKHVAVLVDGQSIIGRIDGALDLERIDLDDIERIEIVQGASSALYGSDALAGVIHIITRTPEAPLSAEGKVTGGSLGLIDLHASADANAGIWRGRVSAGWRTRDSYDLAPETRGTTGEAFTEAQAAAEFTAAWRALELTLAGEYLRRDLAGEDLMGGRENLVEIAEARTHARWHSGDSGQTSGTLRYALWRDQFLALDNQGVGVDYQETREHRGIASLQHAQRLGAHSFIAGIDGSAEALAGERINAEAETRYRAAPFLQDEWQLARRPLVRLALGGRVDIDSQFGVHATPKAALRWDAGERVVVRASYGWGFRAPDFKELYLDFSNVAAGYRVCGNPELAPERSQGVNASVELRPGNGIWASLSGFYNDVDDLIVNDVLPEGSPTSRSCAGELMPFSYYNVAEAFTRGAELRARFTPLSGLSAELSYTLTDARDRASRERLPGHARHQGAATLSYRYRDTEATVRARVVGARPLGGALADPYAFLSARISQRVHRRLAVFAGVQNILDAGDPLTLPIAPRSFYGGAELSY